MQTVVNLWPLIGVLVIVVGFVLRFNPLLVVTAAAIATGLAAQFPLEKILATMGDGFLQTRALQLILLLPLAVIGLLERHGLQVRAALLFDRPTPQQTEDGLADWIRMFDKAPFAGVPEELQETIIREAVETLRPVLYHDGCWYVDYVRIRIKAVKEGK